ncbi:hypothetical protein [Dokdonia sp.]|uniref:hypothetical protein n=1 Tax=Dokdonia sp. TaxID=2024995 RepID=UPI003262F397
MAGRIMYPIIGWVYLWIRYRAKDKINNILQSKYNNRYFNAGTEKTWQFLGIVVLALILFFLASVVYSTIKFGSS